MTTTPEHLSGNPDVPGDVLAVDSLHLDGAIFLRAEYTEGWAYESPSSDVLAQALRPTAERLTMFHIVAGGECWISLAEPGAERHWAAKGDVIVIPYGDGHCMGGRTDAEVVPVLSLLDMPPWAQLPVIRHGLGGDQTDIVCGYLEAQHPLFDPALRALPGVFVVSTDGPAAAWVRASIDYAIAASGGDVTGTGARIPELLLVEVLRLHLATVPEGESGWLNALNDPVVAPALALLHGAPEHHWTVADLASEVAVSRSLLDERFRRVLGRSPIRYLTDWRMHVAKDLLRDTDLGVAAVARRVGYEAEEAFSRAFKRAMGVPPSQWRTRA